MKRMNLVMRNDTLHSGSDSDDGGGGNGIMTSGGGHGGGRGGGGGGGDNPRNYECDNCRTNFPNKTSLDRHTLFCKTLADIRRGGGGVSSATQQRLGTGDDTLMPTPREMFILIQELAAKYNKVKEELDVMKQWAKMVGRRISGSGSVAGGTAGGPGVVAVGGGGLAGLDFTSITRQKRQNMEVILNEEDAEHPNLAELRPTFTEWVASPLTITDTDLNVVFNEDLVAGITAAILRVLAHYTAESGRSHLLPFKLADIKQGAFCIFDTAFSVAAAVPVEFGSDPPIQAARRWRAMEPCEFQLLVRTFHKLLFKEFKKWQDSNWEAQKQLTQQRQMAASSYQQVMSSLCDGGYGGGCGGGDEGMDGGGGGGGSAAEHMPITPISDTVLSDDFATLYNKYADKMMGGALSDDTILNRVRAKLWKDMKAWRL